MAATEPPGNPLSSPQLSHAYCEIIRCGLTACAAVARHTSTSAALVHLENRCFSKARSREVFEFLNDNLSVFLERIPFTGDDVQHELQQFLAGSGYSGVEIVLVDHGPHRASGRTANSFETCPSSFPEQSMRERTGRLGKVFYVPRNVKRLNAVLGIVFSSCIAPATDFNVHFAEVLISAPPIVGMYTQNGSGFQMRSVTHHEGVRSVP